MYALAMRLKRFLFLIVFVLLVSCADKKPTQNTSKAILSGYVLNSPAGSGIVADIQFVAKTGRVSKTVSSSNGSFEIELQKGEYSALVTGQGLASSRVEGLNLVAGKNEFDFIALQAFSPNWSVEPPELKLSGPVANKIYNGQIPFSLQTKTNAPLQAIYVAVGHTPGKGLLSGSQLEFVATKDTGWRTIDISRAIAGKSSFEVVVYDQNNNRSQIIVPINIKETKIPNLSLEPISDIRAVSITFNRNLETLSLDKIDEIPHSIVIQLQWADYSWPEDAVGRVHGFRVWQEIEGKTKLLGIAGANKMAFFDRSASLEVGKKVTYSIAPFIANQEAGKVTDSVTPLAPFRVELVSPADNSVVGAYPKFSWRAVPEVGEEQIYYPLFWNNITGKEVSKISKFGFTRDNEIEIKDSVIKPLWPGRRYGWELLIAYAVDDKEKPKAYSIAVDRDGALGGAYVPGPFAVFEVE